MDLSEFTERFVGTGDETTIVLDVGRTPGRWPHLEVSNGGDVDVVRVPRSPHIVVRNGPYVAVLQLQGHEDHLAIDVHPFVDGRDARAGAFGMEAGRRYDALPATTGGTSHGWPAVRLVTVLVGKQTEEEQAGQ